MKAFANDMSVEEVGELIDRNETFDIDQVLWNLTEGSSDDLLKFLNITLHYVNATQKIDSFYFYQVSPSKQRAIAINTLSRRVG